MMGMDRFNARNRFYVLSCAFCTGLLTLLLNLTVSQYGSELLVTLFGYGWLSDEIPFLLVNVFLYLLMLLLPLAFASVMFRNNPFAEYKRAPGVPRFPFLYLPMVIGLGYLLNFLIQLWFGDVFARFGSSADGQYLPITTAGILLQFFRIAILPPLVEEWLFRGVLISGLRRQLGDKWAIFLSALLFGLAHTHPTQSISALVFGLFAGYAYVSTGSIWYGVLMHMVNNAISVSQQYWVTLFRNETAAILFTAFIVGMMVLGVLFAILYVSIPDRRIRISNDPHAERRRPSGRTIAKQVFLHPALYLLLALYGYLLWIYY